MTYRMFTEQLQKDEENIWRGFCFRYMYPDMEAPRECGRDFFKRVNAVDNKTSDLLQSSWPNNLKLFELGPWFHMMSEYIKTDPTLKIMLVDEFRSNGDKQIAAIGRNGYWNVRPQYAAVLKRVISGGTEKMIIPSAGHWT